jgi:hypothetical protein
MRENQKIESIAKLLADELYIDKTSIALNLKEHVYALSKANKDAMLLGVMYIHQLLESPAKDEIRKVLVS